MKNNTMGQVYYVFDHFFWFIIGSLFFASRLFRPLISLQTGAYFTSKESKIVLLGLFLISLTLGIFVTIKKQRNSLQMALTVLSPFGVYLLLEMLPNLPWLLWIAAILCILLILYFVARVIIVPVKPGADMRKLVLHRALNVVYNSRLVVSLLLAGIVVIAGACSVFDVYITDLTDNENYSLNLTISSNPKDYTTELADLNIDAWNECSRTQRLEVIRKVVDIETAYLGLPDKVVLRADQLNSSKSDDTDITTLGNYNPVTREIAVDYSMIDGSDPQECVDTVLHEMYHSFQHQLCDAYGSMDARYRSLFCFKDVSTYVYEFEQYVDGEDDLYAYKNQLIEEDARNYADSRITAYWELFYYESE